MQWRTHSALWAGQLWRGSARLHTARQAWFDAIQACSERWRRATKRLRTLYRKLSRRFEAGNPGWKKWPAGAPHLLRKCGPVIFCSKLMELPAAAALATGARKYINEKLRMLPTCQGRKSQAAALSRCQQQDPAAAYHERREDKVELVNAPVRPGGHVSGHRGCYANDLCRCTPSARLYLPDPTRTKLTCLLYEDLVLEGRVRTHAVLPALPVQAGGGLQAPAVWAV